MCCKRTIVFKAGDHIKVRKSFNVSSGEHEFISKGTFGVVKNVDNSNAIVVFAINGVDHEIMVRSDYMKLVK